MPIRPPALDDRSFDDLVNELLSRIPAHTPEWTHPRQGDPGRTLLELFAWLTDTLLYRANLIPERQRLAFLRLLDVPMRPARPARTLVAVTMDDEQQTRATTIQALAKVSGPVTFETRTELTVLPIQAEAYYKRPLPADGDSQLQELLLGLQVLYRLGDRRPQPYVTTPVFAGGAAEATGFDLVADTVDRCLWLALLAPTPDGVEAVRESLGRSDSGGHQLISVGVVPALEVPALFADIGPRARIPHLWEVTGLDPVNGRTQYHPLDVIADSTAGLTRPGVQRLALPAARFLAAPGNDVRSEPQAGVGDQPPRLDDPKSAARLVTWLRLRPLVPLQSLALSWVGINAVEVEQRQSIFNRVVGQSNGRADQELQLPGRSVEAESLQLQVEEPGLGFRVWRQIDDLALAGRDDPVYRLDSEAGTVRFGDGVRGRIPPLGGRIRVGLLRAGGGQVGNVPAGALNAITAVDLQGRPVPKLKVAQPLPATGGEDAETLEAAEQRIPALFRHRDRAVTADDYRRLAAETPGVRLGRVEVLPRFRPQQRDPNATGVVSVMVWPLKETPTPPNPRADRPTLEAVHAHLDQRRPLATELYVIGCEYVPLGVSVGITIADGAGQETVLNGVREALRRFLWPLGGGGPLGNGWPLNTPVRDRELEVAVARVEGVRGVRGVRLFRRQGDDWQPVAGPNPGLPQEVAMARWQLPELLSLVVVADVDPPGDLSGVPNPFAADTAVAVPVVPEVCY
ncbi:MAG: hypothetical protein KatS3mg050_1026 [Litorilinea sp.]|nr:MAG: hypothetical protein KatS3mg050_1026 [Litorilinea sp.]